MGHTMSCLLVLVSVETADAVEEKAAATAPEGQATATQPAADRPFAWSQQAARGLRIGLRLDRDEYMRGDPIRVECAIRNEGRGVYRFHLPGSDQSASRFVDFFLVLDRMQPVQFSAKLREPDGKDREVQIGPGQTVVVRQVVLNEIEAFRYEEQMPMQRGYPARIVDGKPSTPVSLGPFGQSLQPGEFRLGWLVFDMQARWPAPLSLKSTTAPLVLKPRPWAQLTAAQKAEYLALLKQHLFGDAWSARSASEALAPLGPEAVPILLEAFQCPKEATRAWAIATASSIQDPRLVEPLVRLIQTDRAMGKYFYHLWKQESPRVLQALVQFLCTTPDAEARSWCLRGLRDFARAVPVELCRQMLADPAPAVREAALFYVATRQGPAGAELLRQVLKADPSEQLRGQAADLLARHGGKTPANYAALVAAVAADPSEFVRQMASTALATATGNQWIYPVGPNVTPAQREEIIRKWQAWLSQQGAK